MRWLLTRRSLPMMKGLLRLCLLLVASVLHRWLLETVTLLLSLVWHWMAIARSLRSTMLVASGRVINDLLLLLRWLLLVINRLSLLLVAMRRLTKVGLGLRLGVGGIVLYVSLHLLLLCLLLLLPLVVNRRSGVLDIALTGVGSLLA